MSEVTSKGKKGGWRTLGIWVTLTFVGLALAWYFLIKIASDNAPESIPLEHKHDQ